MSCAVPMLVERYEALRTVFRAGCDAPYVVILPVQPVDMDAVDFHDYPASEKASRVRQLAEEEARCKISLGFSSLSVHRCPPL